MTLREILHVVNFREFYPEGKENTDTVRIYFDFDDWIEFGMYSFDREDESIERVEKTFRKQVLDKEVVSIDAKLDYISIYLESGGK